MVDLALQKVLSFEDLLLLREATNTLIEPTLSILNKVPLSDVVQFCGALGSDGIALICNEEVGYTITWESLQKMQDALNIFKEIEAKLKSGPHGLDVFEVTQAQLEKELDNPTTN